MIYKLLFVLAHYGAFVIAWYATLHLDINSKWVSADYILTMLTLAFTAQMLLGILSRNSTPPPEDKSKDPPEAPLIPISEGT